MKLSLVKADGTSNKLADVEVPDKFYNRLSTGIQVIDLIFGGELTPGILPGSCIFFTGTPGAGKSTMSLQLAEALTEVAGKRVLYNANEEHKAMLKMAADRIGIKGNFTVSQRDQIDALIEHVLEAGFDVLVQDSLQTIDDGTLRGFNLWKSVMRKLVRLTKDHDVTVITIGQVTKGGTFAGPQALAHEADVDIRLSRDKESGNRILLLEKNRFGPAGAPFEFVLSGNGLDFRAIQAAEQQQSRPKRDERKDTIRGAIRGELMKGEMLSAYDYERLGDGCSGGLFRNLLFETCQAMAREGHNIMETKVEGRLHYFMEIEPSFSERFMS